ncbi:hypothetical protein HN873_055149, partial [Arachis hypogaea]
CLCDICGDSYAGEIKKSSDCVCFSPVKGLPCNSFRHFFPSDDVLDIFKKLTRFFKSSGVMAIFDTSCSRDFTLIESCMEFMSRYKQNQLFGDEKNKLSLPMIGSAFPSI